MRRVVMWLRRMHGCGRWRDTQMWRWLYGHGGDRRVAVGGGERRWVGHVWGRWWWVRWWVVWVVGYRSHRLSIILCTVGVGRGRRYGPKEGHGGGGHVRTAGAAPLSQGSRALFQMYLHVILEFKELATARAHGRSTGRPVHILVRCVVKRQFVYQLIIWKRNGK